MAINVLSQGNISLAETFEFNYKEVAIGGKLVKGTVSIPESKAINFTDHEMREYIRTSMATLLAEYMISNGLIELTHKTDYLTFDRVIQARCYLAPSEQVKILRMNYNS